MPAGRSTCCAVAALSPRIAGYRSSSWRGRPDPYCPRRWRRAERTAPGPGPWLLPLRIRSAWNAVSVPCSTEEFGKCGSFRAGDRGGGIHQRFGRAGRGRSARCVGGPIRTIRTPPRSLVTIIEYILERGLSRTGVQKASEPLAAMLTQNQTVFGGVKLAPPRFQV